MIRYLLPPILAGRLVLLFALVLTLGAQAYAQHDLSIFRVSSDNYRQKGEFVSLTFVVTNDKGTDVTGVKVQIDIPTGLRYVRHSLSQNFDPFTGVWDIGAIRYFQPQKLISIDFQVIGEGVLIATAEISAMNGSDSDSTPGNGALDEDDIVSACVTVPIRAECGQSVRLEAPAGYGSYRWFHDGVLLLGQTGPVLNVGASGFYTFDVPGSTATCVLGSCCPADVRFDSISVALSQNLVCTGGFDTAFVSMPSVDTVNFSQVYTWASIDDPTLRFLSCISCANPAIVINSPYSGDSLRYQVSVVTRDAAGNMVCSAGATLTIQVLQAPLLTFTAPAYVCAATCQEISVAPDLAISSIEWTGPNLRTPNGLVMNYCPRPVTAYQRERFLVQVVGADGCIRLDSLFITTMPAFEIAASGNPRLCQNLPADLSVTLSPTQPTDSLRFDWTELPSNPNAGSNLLVSNTASITTDSLSPGSYGFRVSVSRLAPNGDWVCTYEDTHSFQVEPDCQQPRLGGFAWKDGNRDGLRQNFEAPLAGVSAELFQSSGSSTGLTAVTDASGFYEFDNLAIGDYYVQFAPLPGFLFAPQNVGSDEFVDSDADATGRSDLFPASYDEAVHVVGVGYVGDCQLAFVNIVTTPSDCGNSIGSLSFDIFGGSGQYAYEWQPALSSSSAATLLPAGDYTITVTDLYTECVLTQVLSVPGSNNFKLTASSSPSACPLGKGGSITLFTDGGVGPFSVQYAGTDTGTSIANAMPFTIQNIRGGDYDVNVTDASGCVQRVPIEVTENPMLLVLDTLNVVLADCGGAANGSFDVSVSGFSGEYTLTVNGQVYATASTAPSVSINAQASGSKLIEVSDELACVQRFSFLFLDKGPRMDLADIELTNPLCFGDETGAIRSLSGKTHELRASDGSLAGNLPLSNLGAGRYTLIDRSVTGCLATLDVDLNDPANWVVSSTIVGSDCDLSNGSIQLRVSGAKAPYTYVWSDGLPTGTNQSNLRPGDYELVISDVDGCTYQATYTVPDLCVPMECLSFFTVDTMVIETNDAPYSLCLPNFYLPTDQRFFVDDVPAQLLACQRSALVYYNLESLPGDGESGPYLIEFWYGGDDIVIAELFSDGPGLAKALNRADGWGRWQFDSLTNRVTGGQPDRAYGEVQITHVSSGNVFYLTPNILANQVSVVLDRGTGSYYISTLNRVTGCRDSMILIIKTPDLCKAAYRPKSVRSLSPYCDQLATICVDVPFALFADHSLSINGIAYTGLAEPCDLDDVVYYDTKGIDPMATIQLQSWIVEGRAYTAKVVSLDELAARMTMFDNRAWRYDPVLQVLRGGTPGRNYRDLTIRIAGNRTVLKPASKLFDGTRVELLPGSYRAELIGPNACVSPFSIALRCSSNGVPNRDTVVWTVGVGFSDTMCVATNELTGAVDIVENLCPAKSGLYAAVSATDSVCFQLSGIEIGKDTLCIRACDLNGVCDTTIVIIDVRDPIDVLYPDAVDDYDTLSMNGLTLVDVLENDNTRGALTSFEVVTYPRRGRVLIEVGQLQYTPDVEFCGKDSLVYEICNTSGCDRATVFIQIECGELIIYSGFSPNFDGINETFTVVGVDQYPGNRMEVYNRYGNIVFVMDNYDNSWTGTAMEGDELPEGTYFYVFGDGRGKDHTGYVYLKR